MPTERDRIKDELDRKGIKYSAFSTTSTLQSLLDEAAENDKDSEPAEDTPPVSKKRQAELKKQLEHRREVREAHLKPKEKVINGKRYLEIYHEKDGTTSLELIK